MARSHTHTPTHTRTYTDTRPRRQDAPLPHSTGPFSAELGSKVARPLSHCLGLPHLLFLISLSGSLRALLAQGHAGGGGRRGYSQGSRHLDGTYHRLQKPALFASGRLLAPERLRHRCVRAPLTWSRAPPTPAAPPRWCQKCHQSDKLWGRAGGKGPNSSCRPCPGYNSLSLPKPDLFGKAPHTLPRVRAKGEKKLQASSPLIFPFPFLSFLPLSHSLLPTSRFQDMCPLFSSWIKFFPLHQRRKEVGEKPLPLP